MSKGGIYYEKRIVSILLTLSLVLSYVPVISQAAQEAPQIPTAFAGGCDGNHEGWIPISDAENRIVSDNSAKYYLVNDVDTIHTHTNQDVHVTVCLNGHSIVGSKGFTCLGSYAGSVTIADCKGTGVVEYGLDVGQYTTGSSNNYQRPVMILEGGIYRKWTRVNVGATLIMNGGHLEGTSAKYASLVSYGMVTINGGYITQTNGQPGVRMERPLGSFTMNGGVIDVPGNYGIYNSAIARFYIYGGTIYDRGLNGALKLEGKTRVDLEGVVRILGKGIVVGDTTIDPIFRYYNLEPGSEIWISTEKAGDVTFCTTHSQNKYLHAYGDDRVILHNDNKVILHKHGSWQGATCVTPGICGTTGCNQTGSVDGNVHVKLSPWKNTVVDGVQQHYRVCADCGVTVVEGVCEGGVSTCNSMGVCQVCNAEYLPLDPDNHASQEQYIEYIDDATHGIYHSCCDALKETQTHTPAAGAEATCQGVATCGTCNIAYGSTNETNHAGKLVWLYRGNQKHIQVWDCCNTPNTDLQKHNMVYTAEGLTITGKCAQCEAGGTVSLSVTGGTYTGYAFEATTEGTGDLGGWDPFEEPVLTYCCEDGCKTAGTHTVTMTMGEASVSETFTITPKTLTIDTVNALTKSYDGSDKISLYSLKLDGVVVYDAGQYPGEWDDDRDRVHIVDDEQLVLTVSGSDPGYYETVAVTGIRLEGSDAGNYVIAESFDAVPLQNENRYEYEIRYRDIFVTIEDQQLVGENAPIDQSKYILEGLDEKFTIEGITLYDNGMGQIDLNTSSVVIRLGDKDVTENFDFRVSTGNLSHICEGHTFNSNGFCATGQCDSYQPAEKHVQIDEWDNEVVWYEVSNAGQLYWVAEQVNVYYNNYINVRLTDNITVNEDLTADDLRTWTPIGKSYPIYCGMFEGDGHTISGLYLNDPEMDYVGLFGYTDYTNPVTDVHLTDSYFEGNSYVGGLFGSAGSNISGCSVSDTVTVKGNNSVGGIAGGSQYGELKNSMSLAKIIPGEEGYDRGGLVGYNRMSISNCYTTDSVIVGGNSNSYGGEFSNNFFLADADDELEGTTPMTMEQLLSGQIAYLLQAGVKGEEIYDEATDSYITLEPEQLWGQTIGDGFPALGGEKVYAVLNCKDETGYSNTDAPLDHNFENGSCTVCGIAAPDPAVTGISITVDGVTYTEGNVTIKPDSTIVYTATGTSLDKLMNHSIAFANGVTSSLSIGGGWDANETNTTLSRDVSDRLHLFFKCDNYRVYYETDTNEKVYTDIYLTFDGGSDPATITGLELIADGVSYTEGNVVVKAETEIKIIVHGTKMYNLNENYKIDTPSVSVYLDRMTIDFNTATQDAVGAWFERGVDYPITYTTDGGATWIDSGITVTFVKENNGPAEITGLAINVDGVTYTEGNVIIRPDSTVSFIVTGLNLENVDQQQIIDTPLAYLPLHNIPLQADGTYLYTTYPSAFVGGNNYNITYTNDNWDTTIASDIYVTYQDAPAIWTLTEDTNTQLSLTKDLYVDLNGYDLSGSIVTNGYKVYGIDLSTDEYTCDNMGYFSCVDENGNKIIPERFHTTEDGKRYMTIGTDEGYTFHRFSLEITHLSLDTAVTGFGYKAEFYGDELFQTQVQSISYNLWLTEDNVVSRSSEFANKMTLRLKNFDVANYGEAPVHACVSITLLDGTVLESATESYSMRQMVEMINERAASFEKATLRNVALMIRENPTMESWQVENILAVLPPVTSDGEIDFGWE